MTPPIKPERYHIPGGDNPDNGVDRWALTDHLNNQVNSQVNNSTAAPAKWFGLNLNSNLFLVCVQVATPGGHSAIDGASGSTTDYRKYTRLTRMRLRPSRPSVCHMDVSATSVLPFIHMSVTYAYNLDSA